MSSRRICSLVALLLALGLPATSQAQFGKLIDKARALRTKVDSAKALVDTSKTVVVASKAAVTDATSGLPSDSAGATGPAAAPDTQSKGGKGSGAAVAGSATGSRAAGSKAAGSKAAGGRAAAGGPSATPPAAARTARTANAPANANAATTPAAAKPATTTPAATTPAAPAATRTSRPTRGGAQPPITESLFAQFARGLTAQNAHLKASPGDAIGAMNDGVAASGLSEPDYASVDSRVMMYGTFASKNKEAQASKIFDPADLTVLNAHKSQIVQLLQP